MTELDNGPLWRALYRTNRSKASGGGRNSKCLIGWKSCIHKCQGGPGLTDLLNRNASEEEVNEFLKTLGCVFLSSRVAEARENAANFGVGAKDLEERIIDYESRCLALEENMRAATGESRKKLEDEIRSLRGGIRSSKNRLWKLNELLQS